MERWGRFVARRAKWVLALAGMLLVAAGVLAASAFSGLANGGFDDPSSESSLARRAIEKDFAHTRADIVVLYSSKALHVEDKAFADAVTGVTASLDSEHVDAVTTWYESKNPELVSADYRSTRVVIRLAGSTADERLDAYKAIKDALPAAGLDTHVGGPQAVFADVNSQVGKDIGRAEGIAMPIVFLLSLVIFGSVVSALMPTLIGMLAIAGAFASLRLLTEVTDVSIFAINVVTLLGMGLAIDYALFIVNRFREEMSSAELQGTPDAVTAMGRTMATAGRTVVFSGVLVAASLASLLVFEQMFLRSMSMGGMAAVLVAMLTAITVLPAALILLGRRLEWGSMPWRRRGSRPPAAGWWGRLAAGVMRRPVLVLVIVVAALVALGAPFLSARWGSVDDRVLPQSAASRQANDALKRTFNDPEASATIVLAETHAASSETWLQQARKIPGVTGARIVSQQGAQQLAVVSWDSLPQSEESKHIVRALRDLEPQRGEALVGGPTAETLDLISSVGERLPIMIALVIAVMFVLLFLAFGSLLLPVKAIVMNVVSMGASFGVVTLIFQEGYLSGLLGFTSSGYLEATQPLLMAGILFGLSMDYEVFLLSRIREEWDRARDNTAAVVTGVEATGGIITSAALLLAVVIGGFSTSGIVFIKMIGVGMLVAVLIDATLVRALLVPAAMRLMGQWNWWAPGPLARWWKRHGHREVSAAPVAAQPVSPFVS